MIGTELVGCGSAPGTCFSGPQMYSQKGWDHLNEPGGSARPAQALHRFPLFSIDLDIC
jgi:hypothetical protein